MKGLLLTALIVFKGSCLLAQTDSLVLNNANKYIYYQVITAPSISADTLYNRALSFLQAYPKDRLKTGKPDRENGKLYATGSVLVSKKSLVALHEDASVAFNLIVEVKEGRYRYWFTDFIIVPLERDRYANYVPVAGKKTALENGLEKLSPEDFNGYLKKVLTNCREIGSILKSYMQSKAVKVKEVKRETTVPKEW